MKGRKEDYPLWKRATNQVENAMGEAPVSYTHLDVYKRQAVGYDWARVVLAV